ncbi:MAG TPA: lysophospholipid acyltransferase family protein [Polyangiaceae bacterium]|nr:lysophospholipid acyltransferase family protein [Polyangiaceae bacterium]
MLRAPLRAAAMGGVSGAMLAALMVEHRVRPVSDGRLDAYVRGWARSLLRVLHVDLKVDARPGALEKTGAPRLVVANHRSTVDILLMLHLFGGHLLARGDMAHWPAIGVMARRAGTLFVDREDPASGAAAVQSMRERLRRGITVCVFPEGTTFRGDEVREFQAGAFIAVAREKGLVTPAGIAYETPDAVYGDEPVGDHMKRLVQSSSIRVAVAVGAPFSAAGAGVRALAERARGEVQALVVRARGAIGGRP